MTSPRKLLAVRGGESRALLSGGGFGLGGGARARNLHAESKREVMSLRTTEGVLHFAAGWGWNAGHRQVERDLKPLYLPKPELAVQ